MANYGFRLFIEEQLFVYVRGNMVFQVSVTVETNILSTIPGMITVLLLAEKLIIYIFCCYCSVLLLVLRTVTIIKRLLNSAPLNKIAKLNKD